MSSCISGGGGRTYRLDLDIIKSSSSSPPWSSHSSSPSSTLSESSNSPVAIYLKKPRTPRKRPNQTYNEAAALLSTIYPNIFSSTKSLNKISKQTQPFNPFPEPSDLLPAFPVLSDAAFLIHKPSPEPENPVSSEFLDHNSLSPSPVSSELRDASSAPQSPANNEFLEPTSPVTFEDDFDAESILDEEVEGGIDSIMGSSNNTTSNHEDALLHNFDVNPYLQSLMGFGLGSEFELGLGFQFGINVRRALRHRDGGYRWTPTVPVKDILPKFKMPTPPSDKRKKKKKKKVDKEEVVEVQSPVPTEANTQKQTNKTGLGLKLNHDEILTAWSDHGSMFSDGSESPNSAADALAKLTDMDLIPENWVGGGVREASVMRYKEKRRSRLFSKKIRYQVRKTNADQRPRMKASGRFVRRPSLLQQAIEEGNQ
ncbi:protein CHLOROPLAST IMPORT APPARATUS 2-like isoform X1 [Typha latifolia]|uniref:protein CHLOROPLAST IMPORT APPARATUS 2-like isoform X1 n=1 Tax=Typha latifolia TaxID=4733 RepID=UPI003C2D9F72